MSKISGILVLAVTRGNGISRKGQTPVPYDFCTITYLVPSIGLGQVDKPECKIDRFGFDTMEMYVKPESFSVLCDCPKLKPITLILETNPRNPSNNIVVGFELESSVKP